ncbi:hypothetical protein [Vibrio sinaloensis]|uniref:hypothetical protein n=1 Tax=Photobacterium sp. (strain ATCC 43367) TaxID=379097 RepID=UPI0035E7C8D0
MPFFLIITLLLAMFALITFYFYHDNKQKTQQQSTKKSLVARVEKLKKRFKSDIKPLVDSGCLTQTEGDALYRVANYYFVYQAMTVENVAHYEQLISDLFKVIEFDVFPTLNADSEVPELTKNALTQLVHSLPPRVDGYTVAFYRSDLPVITQRLKASFSSSESDVLTEDSLATD